MERGRRDEWSKGKSTGCWGRERAGRKGLGGQSSGGRGH